MRHGLSVTLFVALVLGPAPASARERGLAIAGDLGFGAISDSAVATIQTGLDILEGRLSVGLFGRVRLHLGDSDEEIVHGRDYDEASDYVHLLRYLKYSHDFQPVQLEVKAGELLGHTLGRGSLVRDYSNIADPDHPHPGLMFRLTHPRFEIEGLLDNVIRPAVVGLRVQVVPAASLPGLRVGATAVLDPTAPIRIPLGEDGLRLVDSAWNLEAETEVMTLLSVDIGYEAMRPGLGKLEPYVEVATSLMGLGVHAGLLGQLELGASALRLGLQAEYRFAHAAYVPGPIDTFYDVERFQAGLTFDDPEGVSAAYREPRLAAMSREAYGEHGALAQVGLGLGEAGRIKLGYCFRPGPDAHSLWLRLGLTPIDRLDLGALVMLRGLESPYAVENGVVALAEARVRINSVFYGLAQYSRAWSLREDTRFFGPLQSFNISLGAAWGS